MYIDRDFHSNMLILLFISPFSDIAVNVLSFNKGRQHMEGAMSNDNRDDYVSIIGVSVDEVMQAFQTEKLGAQSYSILSPIARHRYVVAGANGLEQA